MNKLMSLKLKISKNLENLKNFQSKNKKFIFGILILLIIGIVISGCVTEMVEETPETVEEEAFKSFNFVEGDSESWQVQSSEMGKYVLSPSWFRFEYLSEGSSLLFAQFESLEDARNNINPLSKVVKEPIEKSTGSYSLILSEKEMKETLVNINIAISSFPPKGYAIYKYESGKELPAEEKLEEGKQPLSINFKFLRKIEVNYGSYCPIIFVNNHFYVSYESEEHAYIRIYDKDFNPTGEEYQLTDEKGGDHQIVFADGYFYLVYIGGDKSLHMKKFDSDFNEIKKVTVNEQSPNMEHESIVDFLFQYADGSLYVGTLIDNPPEEGEIPGDNHGLHMRKFNTNLEFQDEFYLSERFSQGMIFHNGAFILASNRKSEDALGNIVILRYDKDWNFIDEKRISFPEPGGFSNEHMIRGFIFENGRYFISYVDPTKKGTEIGGHGDITLKAFDSEWNLLGKVKVNDDIYLNKANRPHLALVGNKIYVAYDVLEEGLETPEGGFFISKIYIKEYEIIEQEEETKEKLEEPPKETKQEETLTPEQKEIVEFLEAEDEQFNYPAVNKILADFRNNYFYYIPGNMTSFTNKEVSGISHFDMDLRNLQDESGEPVVGLGATFTTDLVANNWKKDDTIKRGPPVYVFSYDNVPQEEVYIGGGFRPSPYVEFNELVSFTPGFDAFRSADKTVFSAPGTQTLTLTVIPREKDIEEKGDGFGMCIYTIEPGAENLVDVIITSPTTDGEHFVVSEDKHSLRIYDIYVKTDTAWSINITLEVTPKLGVSKVKFLPFVSFLWNPASFRDDPSAVSCVMESGNSGSKGTTEGSSVSCVTDAGVAKWKAKGNYIWDWRAGLCAYAVMFEHLQERVEDNS